MEFYQFVLPLVEGGGGTEEVFAGEGVVEDFVELGEVFAIVDRCDVEQYRGQIVEAKITDTALGEGVFIGYDHPRVEEGDFREVLTVVETVSGDALHRGIEPL